ncbi:hypothetical protein AN958_04152 [Leucoagaricus sp. SymC.cos]|nr:hypothetical protein AN958_04152 [Leucoagaricus sp. SymC.cos]
MSTLPDSAPRARAGRDGADAERERLLAADPESANYHYRDDDTGPGQPGGAAAGGNIASSSTDPLGAGEENGIKPEGRPGDTTARNLAFIGAATLVITTWVAVISNDPVSYGWFAFHPPLQTLALCFFTYGIMTLQPTYQPRTKAAGFIRHQTAIFYFAFPLIALGTLAAIYNKILRGYPHFKTWHATFGLLCIIWIFVQIFLGAGSVWNGGSLFGGGMKAKAVWKYHRMSGYILFPLMLVTAHLGGGWSDWGHHYTSDVVRFLAYTVAPAVIFLCVYSRIRPSKMKFW